MLTFDQYQRQTDETALYKAKIAEFINTLEIPNPEHRFQLQDLLEFCYVVMGLVGEAGEIANKAKKILRDKGSIVPDESKDDLCKEGMDVNWYNNQMFNLFGRRFEDFAQDNLDKLADRRKRNVIGGSGDNR